MWAAPSEVTVYLGTTAASGSAPGDRGLLFAARQGRQFTLTAGNDFAMAVQNTNCAIVSCRPTSTSWSARATAFMGYTSSPGGDLGSR